MTKRTPADSASGRVVDVNTSPDPTAEPITQLTAIILEEALNAGAQRVHVAFPSSQVGVVRWYVDDDWHEVMKIPRPACLRVANRLKVMGALDITKKRTEEGMVRLWVHGRMVALPILHKVDSPNEDEIFLDCPPRV